MLMLWDHVLNLPVSIYFGQNREENRGPYVENVRNLGGGTPIINGPLSCEWHMRVGSNWPLLASPG